MLLLVDLGGVGRVASLSCVVAVTGGCAHTTTQIEPNPRHTRRLRHPHSIVH